MTPDIAALVERLRAQAESTSKAHRMMAEAKSLRQTDNPEGRSDLYRWLKPDETIEAQAADALTRLSAEVEGIASLEGRLETAEDALGEIVQWADAYPLDIFPEPDFAVCAEALKNVGQALDAVSASNMRHVVKRVGQIARAALAPASSEGEG